MSMTATYLLCSDQSEVTHDGTPLRGVRCVSGGSKQCGRPHFYYAVALEHETAEGLFDTTHYRGRRSWRQFFVSNSTCGVPIGRGGSLVALTKAPPRRLDIDEIHALHRLADGLQAKALTTTPSPSKTLRRPRRRCTTWVPLAADHKRFIAAEIARLAHFARNEQHPMQTTARALVDTLLWCWTADGVDPSSGQAGRDKMKYNFEYQRFTLAAHTKRSEQGTVAGLRHEHIVPRCALIDCILSEPGLRTEEAVFTFLEHNCFAVIITKDQDDVLSQKFKDSMPPSWNWESADADPFVRYREAGLDDEILGPLRAAQPAHTAGGISRHR
ncbi:hypothetical protein WMF39_37605 [Sorangium sp. So ce1504]|uniref:hypothetical protein n=1 Tax=Sorangium sp. So ce1504 TaxID=3133337 RepID=UPI003F616D51